MSESNGKPHGAVPPAPAPDPAAPASTPPPPAPDFIAISKPAPRARRIKANDPNPKRTVRPGQKHRKPGKRHHNDKWDLRMEMRRFQAIELRMAGKSYKAIAQELGVSVATIFSRYIQPVMQDLIEESRANAGKIMQAQWLELEELKATFRPQALAGSIESAAMYMKILERQAKLAGTDAPAKTDNMLRGDGSTFLTREQNDEAISTRLAAFLVTSKN